MPEPTTFELIWEITQRVLEQNGYSREVPPDDDEPEEEIPLLKAA